MNVSAPLQCLELSEMHVLSSQCCVYHSRRQTQSQRGEARKRQTQ